MMKSRPLFRFCLLCPPGGFITGLAACLILAGLWGCSDDSGSTTTPGDEDAGMADVESDDGAEAEVFDTDLADILDAEEDVGPQLPPQPWDVTAPGPFNVSYIQDSVTYTPRGENEEPRTLRVAIWYPTLVTEGPRARYFNLRQRYPVFADAPVAVETPMPVLVFSHGNSSIAEQSYFMTEFFASHGWIVIAPDHKGNTFFESGGALTLDSAVYRPQDISATLDFIVDVPEEHRLFGLASNDVALSGHSFGGYTTLASTGAVFKVDEVIGQCERGEISDRFCSIFGPDHIEIFREGFYDPRIKVSLPQTPAGAEIFDLSPITIPTLLWTGSLDRTLPNEDEGDPLWESMLGPPHRRIDLTTAGHFTFSNMCEILGFVDLVADDGCGEGFIHYEEAFPTINAYSLAFARHHLFGDDSVLEFVDGTRRLTEAMVFSRKD